MSAKVVSKLEQCFCISSMAAKIQGYMFLSEVPALRRLTITGISAYFEKKKRYAGGLLA